MKYCKLFKNVIMILIMFCLTACSSDVTDSDVSMNDSNEYKDGYMIASYKNFSDIESFEDTEIYLEGTLSKIDGNEIFITDSEGFDWIFTSWNNNHNFEKYIGSKCECYCLATGISALYENTIIISFEENPNYKILFEDNELYSEYENCTMHSDYDEPYIAFGGLGSDGIREYNVFDLGNNCVRNIKIKNNKWYYADATYTGLAFHQVDAEFSEEFSISYRILNNNSDLMYFVNGGTGIIAPVQDYSDLNSKINNLISTGNAIAVTSAQINEKSNNANLTDNSNKNHNSGDSKNTGVIVPGKDKETQTGVWVPTQGGTKYHTKSSCSNMVDPIQVALETAKSNGYTACGRCH